MRVGERDRVRVQSLKFSEPIKAAIDHHLCAAIRDEQRSVHAMLRRARFDLAARAEEGEFHGFIETKQVESRAEWNGGLLKQLPSLKPLQRHPVVLR